VHVLGDGQFGDLVAEPGEFGPNAPAAPRRILSCHPPDQLAKLGVEPRAAARIWPGLPVPVALEASAVPGQHRGGLDDDETGPPGGLETGLPDPEDPVPSRQTGSGHGSLEDQELMVAERQILDGYGRSPEEQARHGGTSTGRSRISSEHPGAQAWHLRRDLTGSAAQVVR
jgi:hypothetical protein